MILAIHRFQFEKWDFFLSSFTAWVSLFSRGLSFRGVLKQFHVCFSDINGKKRHRSYRECVKTKWRIHQSPLLLKIARKFIILPEGTVKAGDIKLDIDQILSRDALPGTARRFREILRLSFDNWIMRKKFTTLPLSPRRLLKKSVSYPVCRSPNPVTPLSPFTASKLHPPDSFGCLRRKD